MASHFSFRWANPDDYGPLGALAFEAVRTGESPYSEAQRAAWMPEPRCGSEWNDRLSGQQIIVAEADGEIEGFMSLAPLAYIDFAFIRPKSQGSGLFRRLLSPILTWAKASGATEIDVHASLVARPAFEACGFKVLAPEIVEIGDQQLLRFLMQFRFR